MAMRFKDEPRQASPGPVWHRAGWSSRPSAARADAAQQDGTSVEPLNAERARRLSLGPVAVRTHTHVFAHSRVMQHMHRTVLARSWCPGLYGTPAAEPNTGFYSELDVRLANMHNSLSALNSRSRALRRQQEGSSSGRRVEGASNLLHLRRTVNATLDTQMDFFTRCMASYSLEEGGCACVCPSCNCTCRQTDRMLKNLIYGAPSADAGLA